MQTSLFRAFVWLLVFCTFSHTYSFTSTLDKHSVMMGEKTVLTLKFCYDDLEEYSLEELQLQYFKIVFLNEYEKEGNQLSCITQRYSIIANKSGDFILPALKAHIESIPKKYQELYNKNHYLQKIDIYTKSIPLKVTPLPQNLKVTGDYRLIASIDKKDVNAQNPIHFTVTLKGKGNIENLDFLTLSIPHALVYPHTTTTLSKTFDIVSDDNYTIPAISLSYFNQENHMVENISTDTYQIVVKSNVIPSFWNTYILIWLLIFVFLLLFYLLRIFRQIDYIDEKKMLFKRIKQAKNKEDLLKVIALYMHVSKAMERLVYRVEMSERSAFKGLKKETTTQLYLLTQNSNKFI
ncbi:MAG: BatD family protein [Epsilonproteobacteria bacterium]|nr:BatD family protein [Campylobacterota bacterium]